MTETLCSSTHSNIDARQNAAYTTICTHGVNAGSQFTPQRHTALKCWHCVHSFDGIPCYIPMNAFEGATDVLGNFCSWSCAIAWAIERKMHTTSDILMHINVAASKQNVSLPIVRAPPTYALQDFGGCMTIDEFRKVGRASIPTRVLTEPCLSFPIAIEGWKQEGQQVMMPRTSTKEKIPTATRGLYHEYCEKNVIKPTDAPIKRRRHKAGVSTGPLAHFIKHSTVADTTNSHALDVPMQM